jgi:Excalibur calcium-binding domain
MKKALATLLIVVGLTAISGAPAEAAAKRYKNCKALNRDYPNGVSRKSNPAVYKANTHLDRDNDGRACEKK